MRAAWRTDAEYKATRRRTSRKSAFRIVSHVIGEGDEPNQRWHREML